MKSLVSANLLICNDMLDLCQQDGDITATYEEILTLNGNKRVTFSGGYDQGYTTVKGKTGVSGRLTLSTGLTTLENIEVR